MGALRAEQPPPSPFLIGSVESDPLTITRTAGTVDAITVDIGTLPGLPTGHYGYRLAKSSTSDGDNTPVSFAITIPDYKPQINNAPAFTAGSGTTRSVAENTPAGVNIGGARVCHRCGWRHLNLQPRWHQMRHPLGL